MNKEQKELVIQIVFIVMMFVVVCSVIWSRYFCLHYLNGSCSKLESVVKEKELRIREIQLDRELKAIGE